jgi:methylamine--corrinoid protein Co-methyltransferase
VYVTNSSRRILFTREELEGTIRQAPSQAVLGEGADAHVVAHREVEDERPPFVVGGPIGTPLDEEMYLPIMQSYVQEPMIQSLAPGTMVTTHGHKVRTRSPLEVIAAWEEVDLMFSALDRAGRPGLSIGAVQMGLSDVGYLSSVSRFGYRPTDRHTIAMMGELKTSYELLNKLAHSVRQGGIIAGFYNPILGGFAGGEEGLAVLITAGMIALHMVYISVTHSTCPTHPSLFNDTAPQILRAVSAATAAISRNSPLMTMVMTSPVGGPGTDTVLYECVAMATTASVCGAAQVFGTRSAVGVVANHCSGLEARFNGEVGHAAAGLSRTEAEGIVQRAVAAYEPVMADKPIGKPFNEVYDTDTVTPSEEWLGVYDRVKEEAARWGLRFT